MTPTPALVLQLVEQHNESHEKAHQRVRGSLSAVEHDVRMVRQLAESLERRLSVYDGIRDRRKELSASRLVIFAAAIGALPHLIEVIVKALGR